MNAANAGTSLPPYKSKQQELGIKLDIQGLGTSLSVFQIEKPSASLDTVSNIYAENGRQRNRGIEWSIFGAPTRNVRLLGGVTLMQGKLVESATLGLVGKHAPGVPGVQANIGAEWDVLWAPGLSLNARLAYSGKQYLDQLNTQQIPSWTRWDVGAQYKTAIAGKPITLRLRIDNLFNKNYWESVYTDYTSLSSPRTVTLSATFDF
jgi:iron complex outermembrane receptor protein